MAASELSLDEIYNFFVEKGGIVANRDVVRHFKKYLTDPSTQDDARTKFKKYVNQLATTKTEGNEKFLILRPKYSLLNEGQSQAQPQPPASATLSTPYDSRMAQGLPISPSPSISFSDFSPSNSPASRQPPPYRPPPPVTPTSFDNVSISSSNYTTHPTIDLESPTAPPRKKFSEKKSEADLAPVEYNDADDRDRSDAADNDPTEIEKQSISVKERMQKFNKMASADDESSPRQKDKKKQLEKGAEEDDGASVISLDPKRCAEWYVTAAKGHYQDLAKLASDEPRFVKLKDPYTAYTVLHWGAKHGNMDVIKLFAGKYRCDVNAKTSGGYTPLHIAAQFGHEKLYDLLIDVYGGNPNVRDYSGRFPSQYKISQLQTDAIVTKKKGRKKTAEKEGFLRIGSLNVRVKKTTEAFSNFLGVGNAAIISPVDSGNFHKGWGSADNVGQEGGIKAKRKIKRPLETSGTNSTPGTPNNYPRALTQRNFVQDSDSDSAAGFDSNWKN